MYRKTSARPAFEEEPPSDEDMIQKSLEGSRRTSNLSRRRSRFGDGEEDKQRPKNLTDGMFATRLNKSRLTDQNEFSPKTNKGDSPEFQEDSPETEYPAKDEREQGEEFEADEALPTNEGFAPDAPGTKYFGFTKLGQKHGMGLLVHRDFEYEGQFKDDQYCGLGRLRTLDFEYEGAFENSLPQGAGLLVKDTGIYKGKFEGGFDPEGLGEIQIPGGAVYRGMISAARLHGFGTLTDSKGKTYTGYWKDGLKEGSGREKTKAGEYVGSWSKGKRHGAGTYTAADWKYEGDWRSGKREGVGLYKEGPVTYLGTFEADLRNGLGKLIDSRSSPSFSIQIQLTLF